jgi:hypothetical protein
MLRSGVGRLDRDETTMAVDETAHAPRMGCQARPIITRRGWRDDVLCASSANTTVAFHGGELPVCRIHKKAYGRWGDDAEGNAELLWGWIGDAESLA